MYWAGRSMFSILFHLLSYGLYLIAIKQIEVDDVLRWRTLKAI